jgi:hypothetical protein
MSIFVQTNENFNEKYPALVKFYKSLKLLP